MPRETIIYREKYHRGSALKAEFLPVMKHTPEALTVVRAELLEAGRVEIAGVRQEYQILKVYFKP